MDSCVLQDYRMTGTREQGTYKQDSDDGGYENERSRKRGEGRKGREGRRSKRDEVK